MLTILATAGAADANSFATEAEAIEYAATRLNLSGWTTVAGTVCTEDEKRALVEATRELDQLRFVGYRGTNTQRLSWPRMYAPKVDGALTLVDESLVDILVEGPYYGMTEVPQLLKEAQIELAFEFLRAGSTDISRADSDRGVIRKKVDVLETEWEAGSRLEGLARFPRVLRLVMGLLASGSARGPLTVERS